MKYADIVENFLTRNKIEFTKEVESANVKFNVNDLVFVTVEDWNSQLARQCEADHTIIITSKDNSANFGKANSTKSNGLKYLKKCPNPLIGVDIELFTESPAFPFREDRPECFYKVRVDGQRSAYEGFYDEAIRWKMIVNRVLYSGGFIDNNWIMQAMNISRTTKAPSWFSESLARNIIQTYCSADLIFDPFAGWGARHDAAAQLNRPYLGSDFNQELVEWHKSKGRNIDFADANERKCDKECSIFICPPYSDPKTGRCFEDYNFDGFDNSAKALSQCDWLKITIQNAPKFVDATMVCKIVDKGWEKYVVDKVSRKSHFGDNFEYIIHLTNKDEIPE